MIISHVVKESEQKGEQAIIVKGSVIEIDTELTNIIRELLKRGFPEDILISSVIDAIEENHNK